MITEEVTVLNNVPNKPCWYSYKEDMYRIVGVDSHYIVYYKCKDPVNIHKVRKEQWILEFLVD
jgi:hypothetical protein